jgi:hypothetical protein
MRFTQEPHIRIPRLQGSSLQKSQVGGGRLHQKRPQSASACGCRIQAPYLRFQTVDARTLAAPVTAHTPLAHRDRTDVYIAVKDAPAFLASFVVAAVGEGRHGAIEARTKPAGRCPLGWAGPDPDHRGSAGSTHADQQAFHPSGNGIRGQASWLSFVAFGRRMGEMAVLTASSNRSNSTSVIALSKFRRAEILTLRITIFPQINDAQLGG